MFASGAIYRSVIFRFTLQVTPHFCFLFFFCLLPDVFISPGKEMGHIFS